MISTKFRSYSLRTAVIAFVLTPILAVAAAVGWYGLRSLEAQAEASMQEDIELIARAVRLPISYAMENGRMGAVHQALSSTTEFRRVYGIHVYNREGQRLATSGSPKAQVRDRSLAAQTALKGEQGTFNDARGKDSVFSYFVPLTDSGEQIIGLLQVTRRGSDFSSAVDQIRMQSLAALGVIGVIFLTIIFFGYRMAFGRHMRDLYQGTERVAAGDMRYRFDYQGPIEISFLQDNINKMLDSIVASENEIAGRREKEHQLHLQLQQNAKLAAIGRLAAGVAHELGTPLAVADGKAQRGLRRADATCSLTLNEIRQQLARMTRIVQQLMDFARGNQLNRKPIRLPEIARSCIKIAGEQAHQKSVITPSDSRSLSVYADPLRLEQAVTNLLQNALQAASQNVYLSYANYDATHAVLRVEDDGPGVPADLQEQIFEPFFTTKSVGCGTGLGLAIVAAVAREHEGWVRVSDSPHGGACFELILPTE